MSAFGTKRTLLNHTMRQRLLVVGCLARAPSKECGRCLLTKLGLAQFTARLFWRFTGDWWLVFTIFDALSPHAVAARYTRPIRTHHNSTPLNISKAAGKMSKNRRFRRSAPNGPCRWGCRTDNAGAVLPRSDPASIHPRIAAWYKLGKGRCQRVHSKAAGTCRITGGFALAPQTSTWGDVSLGRSNRGIRTNPVQRRKHTPPQSRLGTNRVDSKNFSSNWGGLAIASAHGTGGVIRLSTSARSALCALVRGSMVRFAHIKNEPHGSMQRGWRFAPSQEEEGQL